MENKEKFEKAEIEEIRFEEDIVTQSTGTVTVGGEGAQGFEP